jgi:hypothetical protein
MLRYFHVVDPLHLGDFCAFRASIQLRHVARMRPHPGALADPAIAERNHAGGRQTVSAGAMIETSVSASTQVSKSSGVIVMYDFEPVIGSHSVIMK